jgi:hypothetical protein
LLPNSAQIFRLGKNDPSTAELTENLSWDAMKYIKELRKFQTDESIDVSISSILNGAVCMQSHTLFYVPSAEEICMIDRAVDASRGLKEPP